MFLPCHEYEDQLPHLPALHVVEIHKEEAKPDHGGDVALQHDHREQQATDHGAYSRRAEHPNDTDKGKLINYSKTLYLGLVKRKL